MINLTKNHSVKIQTTPKCVNPSPLNEFLIGLSIKYDIMRHI